MSTEKKSAKLMENAHTADPVNPGGTDPSINSEVHATTAINSSVTPEDYPKDKRDDQVRAATGKP